MLVWATRSHTYALGFHILCGMQVARALDLAVARHLVMAGLPSPFRLPCRVSSL